MNNLLITRLPRVSYARRVERQKELTEQNNSYSNQQHERMMVPEKRDHPYDAILAKFME